jgi:hypothetical protein
MSLVKQYEESCVLEGKTLRGHMVFTPAGSLVRLKAGAIKPEWSHEEGFQIAGLKDGFKMASPADIEKFKKKQDLAAKK